MRVSDLARHIILTAVFLQVHILEIRASAVPPSLSGGGARHRANIVHRFINLAPIFLVRRFFRLASVLRALRLGYVTLLS